MAVGTLSLPAVPGLHSCALFIVTGDNRLEWKPYFKPRQPKRKSVKHKRACIQVPGHWVVINDFQYHGSSWESHQKHQQGAGANDKQNSYTGALHKECRSK